LYVYMALQQPSLLAPRSSFQEHVMDTGRWSHKSTLFIFKRTKVAGKERICSHSVCMLVGEGALN
jgi:hypothetical protein